jgi:hypothetical protein
VTAGDTSSYDQALTLQNWFRDNFTYSLSVPAGHDGDAIDGFLDPRNGRIGYCEQFAGTYAAMARAIGLPSRVAVGFTPGQQDPGDANLYRVRGEHAHAWPEVYLAGFGWMPFEPTPGRGAPGAESYTGVAPDQTSPLETTATTTATTAPAATAPTIPAGQEPAANDVSTGTGAATSGGGGWWTEAATIAALVLGLAALYVVVVAVGVFVRPRLRRRRAGRDPTARTRAAWADANDALADLGVEADPSETPVEFAHRAVTRVEVAHERHLALAEATTEADYGEGGVSVAVADRATADARAVAAEARRRRSWGRRWKRLLDPRRRLQSSRRKRSRIR